jgi:hypothetical protein
MPKEPFHNYDPYDHLATITLRLEEVISQHNNLAKHVENLSTDNRILRHRIAQLMEQLVTKK